MLNSFYFTPIKDRDQFVDWCFDHGIYTIGSTGSRIGEKLGITEADWNRLHRWNFTFQFERFCNYLLLKQIPVLAVFADYIEYCRLLCIKAFCKKPLEDDLDLSG